VSCAVAALETPSIAAAALMPRIKFLVGAAIDTVLAPFVLVAEIRAGRRAKVQPALLFEVGARGRIAAAFFIANG